VLRVIPRRQSYTDHTGNQISADANWTYHYNKEGDLTEKDTTQMNMEKWTYAYSANNLLTEVKHYDLLGTLVLTVDYKYDAFGEMIQKDDGTVVTKFGKDEVGSGTPSDWAIFTGSSLTTRNIDGNGVDQHLGNA
jgi:hypothetical protein